MRVERRLRGEGEFILKDGGRLPSGPVRIEQHSSGRTLLCCERTSPITLCAGFERITGFQGQTTKGQSIQIHDIYPCSSTAERICFRLKRVEIGHQSAEAHTHELSLTNLKFKEGTAQAMTLLVPYGGATIPVRLTPRRNYEARIRYLGEAGDIVPTATLRFRTDGGREFISEFIKDLCAARSLLQGRRIMWIHHATYSKRQFQHAQFGETITKPYNSQSLCFNPNARTGMQLEINAVKEALPAIKIFRETFDPHNRIVNAWLDAKTETDYLEARTLKYVVVVEALNAITLQADRSIPKTVVDSKMWKGLHQKVLASLQSDAVAGEVLTLENWQRINLSSFRDTLVAVCNRHHITVSPSDLGPFARIRNDMVHRLRYDLSIRLPAPWDKPNHPQAALHFFVANFVDRIVLQLFGLGTHLETMSASNEKAANS